MHGQTFIRDGFHCIVDPFELQHRDFTHHLSYVTRTRTTQARRWAPRSIPTVLPHAHD